MMKEDRNLLRLCCRGKGFQGDSLLSDRQVWACLLLILMFACPVSYLQAQEPTLSDSSADTGSSIPLRVMGVKDCMEYALARSTDIQVQKTYIDDQRIDRRDAILSAFTPSVGFDVYAYSNFGRTVDPETNTYISTTSFNNAYQASAGIYLFNGFQAVNNLKISRMALEMGKSELQRISDNVCLATLEAYCNLAYYTRMLEVLEQEVETLKSSLALVERQEQLGQKSHPDVLQARAELADREYQCVEMRNQKDKASLTLKDIMLWPLSDTLVIDTALFVGASGADQGTVAEASTLSGPAQESVVVSDSLSSSSDLASMIEYAQENLPSMAIARSKKETAMVQWKTARWQLLPSLRLSGGWNSSYYTYPGQVGYQASPFWNQIQMNGGEFVQLSLSVPIYDRLSRHSQIRRSKNEYARLSAEYERQGRVVEAEVRKAVLDSEGSKAAYEMAVRKLESQKAAYLSDTRRFELGLISPIEYRSSSELYLKAEADRLKTCFEWKIKQGVVHYYQGIPYLEQSYE